MTLRRERAREASPATTGAFRSSAGRWAARSIGLVLFAVILWRIDLAATGEAILRLRPGFLVLAIVTAIPVYAIKIRRWQRLVEVYAPYSLRRAALAYGAGYYWGLVTPGHIGEFVRIRYVRRDAGLPLAEAAFAAFGDRVLDLAALVLMGAAGFAYFGIAPEATGPVAALAICVATGIAFLSAAPRATANVATRIARRLPGRIGGKLADLAAPWTTVPRATLTRLVAFTFAGYFVEFGQCLLMARALDLPLAYLYVAMAIALARLLSLLPISFGGLGTRLAMLLLVFGRAGVDPGGTTAFELVYILINIALLGAVGYACWIAISRTRTAAVDSGSA